MYTNDGSLGNGSYIFVSLTTYIYIALLHINGSLTVCDESSFYFSGRKSMAGDIHNVVNSASDPVISIMVSASTVSSELFLESAWKKTNLDFAYSSHSHIILGKR